MTSQFGNRASGVAAATGIVLLVLLIVLLWTGVDQELFRSGGTSPRNRGNATGSRSAFVDVADEEAFVPTAPSGRTSGDNKEFVRPIKISPLGLTEEDLLYGGDHIEHDDLEPVQLRHHSGHFRHRTANIWDPHPIYEFTAFQKNFLLVLQHDSGFASPDLKVTHIWHNSSTRKLPNIKSNGCFYKGYVKGDPSSSVAVSLCHGMTGNIRTSTGNYFIQPFEVTSDHAKPMEHVIYEMSRTGAAGGDLSHCGLDDHESFKFHVTKASGDRRPDSEILFDYETGDHHRGRDDAEEHDPNLKNFQHKRSKRNSEDGYFVEMLVVADSSMANYHGSNTENYILALMYIVSGIFKDASIGNRITIAVVKLEIHYDLSFVKYRYPHHDGVSAAEMLREFCYDQARRNDDNEDSEFHHDTALLLTRENICRNASAQKCETLGLAELGTMCDKRSSCSLVQDNGLSAAFTIAHELGHVFNMPHDDAELKCRAHASSDTVSHVMATSLKEGTDPWSWSECSRHFITEFLESRHSFCLKDPPIRDVIKDNVPPDVFPGETIVGNKQCELLYGEGSRICSFMPVCSALWCNKLDSDGCQTLHMPWGDGTPCGQGAWCQKGVCVEKNRRALKKVDGKWGNWEPYGPCSRSCGGGVKKSYRRCDNPRPQNGGSYCTGSRVQYKSCGTKRCPEGSMGFREEQCRAFNRNNHNIHGIPSNVTWVPKYGLLNDDRCVLYCRPHKGSLYYPLKEKVIDGTPCDPDTFDICVNGQCRPAGCDHVLDSKAKLDLCGKCNGQNDTCRVLAGTFNESAHVEGYRTVITIPAGSSNLDIRQHAMSGTKDYNYLVLKDGLTKYGLLNNDNILTTFRKTIQYGDIRLDYSGCLVPVERINASRPLPKDLIVEILSVGNLTPPSIFYQYTVPLIPVSNRYLWRNLDEWEACDHVCNGRQKRKIACTTVNTNEIVPDEHCNQSKRPPTSEKTCNTHCTLKWRITSRSECSNHCGLGVRKVTRQCIQEIEGEPEPFPVHNSSCAHLPDRPPDLEECEGLCSSVDWMYGPWSQCSKSCGTGVRMREALCLDNIGRIPVEEERCDPFTKVVEEMCETQPCPTWSTGQWSECSVTCGNGTRTRGYWCQLDNQVIKMSYCDVNAKPKHEETCIKRCTFWSSSDWGPCSVTCGSGKKRRTTKCKNSEYRIVDDSQCTFHERPTEVERCEQPPCPPNQSVEDNSISPRYDHRRPQKKKTGPRWVVMDGSCSVTCGTGIQTVQVKCMSYNGEEVDTCNPHDRPNTSKMGPCKMGPCPPQWVADPWSPCSSSCGRGKQQRQVYCRHSDIGKLVRDEECARISPKPKVEQECRTPCQQKRKFKWKYGGWSPCSKTCGQGEKVREAKCISIANGAVVEDKFCHRRSPKRKKKKCMRKLCPYTWLKGEWGPCSEKCGNGIQNRTVTCHWVNAYNWLDPVPLKNEYACNTSNKPSMFRSCSVNCTSDYHWSPDGWQECTLPCGWKGTQRRVYKCLDRNNVLQNKSKCADQDKPLPKSRRCNRKPCDWSSCKDIQIHTNARKDDEYTMLVGGKNMSIYCKGMNSASPVEYLTLPYADENFSQFIDKRLINQTGCNGTSKNRKHTREIDDDGSKERCDCVISNHTGYTRFEKVRLLVETLQILTDDFTFSSHWGKKIPFGEAGGCCCQQPCPQGSFRINLVGTSLQIPPIEDLDRKIILRPEEKGFRISGRCGDSVESNVCTSCSFSTLRRLKLHVVPP